jgi:hypothetical protein
MANASSGGNVPPSATGGAAENDPANSCPAGSTSDCGTLSACLDADIDDDNDGTANDGCPVQGQYVGEPVQVCNDGVDNDLDGATNGDDSGCSGWWYYDNDPFAAGNQPDRDGDGYIDSEETRIGTNTADMCGHTGWPSDLFTLGDSFNKLQLQDVTSFVMGTKGTATFHFDTVKGVDPGYDERWNLFNAGGSVDAIDLQDITATIAGPLGGGGRDRPPMLQGQKAFDGPTCPVHP